MIFQTSLVAAVMGFGIYCDQMDGANALATGTVPAFHADLAAEGASPEVQHVAQWAVRSHDHAGLPFVVVDKARARLFAYDPQGRLRGSTPVLLGAARGDDAVVPATPAGRFAADAWQSAQGDGIVWVNSDTVLSLHGVPSERAPGRGVQRLASANIEDRRISDGSLHVAGEFYREYLEPLRDCGSVAYVLPEYLAVQEVFRADSVDASQATELAQSARGQTARRPS